jgi:hypothetical protein
VLPAIAAPAPGDAIILEHTACEGECAVYTVEVHADGQVTYQGEHFVAVLGKMEYRIDPLRAQALFASFARFDFTHVPARHAPANADFPRVVLTLTRGGLRHASNSTPCHDTAANGASL